MHGNELRKAGHVPAAIARLSQAAAMTDRVALRGATLALLARAAAEHGDIGLFDTAIGEASRLLEVTNRYTMLLNPFSIREIRLVCPNAGPLQVTALPLAGLRERHSP